MPTSPQALLALPDGPALRRLRATFMLMGVVPDRIEPEALPQALKARPDAPAFVGLAAAGPGATRGVPDLATLARALPDVGLRGRVWPLRVEGPLPSRAEHAWARALGFAGGDGTLDDLDAAPAWAAQGWARPLPQAAGVATVAAGDLDPQAAALATLRRFEQETAAARTAALPWPPGLALLQTLDLADRRWRLHTYPECFVGREAVETWMARGRLSRPAALALGQALHRLGVVRHVLDEHPFEDAELFYVVDDPAAPSHPPLDRMLRTLMGPGGVPVADRSHLGRSYPRCWVARDAVSWLVHHQGLTRAQATRCLRRLQHAGALEHVLQAHRVLDAELFFRFTDRAPALLP